MGDISTNAVTSLYGAGATFEQHFVPMWKIPFQKATTKAKIAGLLKKLGVHLRQHTSGWEEKAPATHVTLKKKFVHRQIVVY